MAVSKNMPMPEVGFSCQTVSWWTEVFSPEECEDLKTLLLELPRTIKGCTTGNKIDTKWRNSKVAHLPYTDEYQWIYDRMMVAGSKINQESYRYKLTGTHDEINFIVYNKGEHFNCWHLDKHPGGYCPGLSRKLNCIVQLSDPDTYEGGEFQVWNGDNDEPIITAPKDQGFMLACSTFTWHRATPVTKGQRCTLVLHLSGPPFE